MTIARVFGMLVILLGLLVVLRIGCVTGMSGLPPEGGDRDGFAAPGRGGSGGDPGAPNATTDRLDSLERDLRRVLAEDRIEVPRSLDRVRRDLGATDDPVRMLHRRSADGTLERLGRRAGIADPERWARELERELERPENRRRARELIERLREEP